MRENAVHTGGKSAAYIWAPPKLVVMHELIGKYSHSNMDMLKDQLKRGGYMGALGPPTPGTSTPSPFLMPAEFYKSLLATAVLQQQQQQQHHKFYAGTPSPSPAPSLSPTSGRHLLFSTAAAATACVPENGQVKKELEEQDQDNGAQEAAGHEEQKPIIAGNPTPNKPHNNSGYSWSTGNNNEVVSNSSNGHTNNHTNNHPTTPPTPPNETSATQATSVSAINLNQAQPASQTRSNFGSSIKSPPSEPDAVAAATCKSQESNSGQNPTSNSISISDSDPNPAHNPNSNSTAAAVAAAAAAAAAANMPIGGVQGQNPTQGLVHWMSAVMAEHMTGQTHLDPGAVGMHYMWNGNVDVSIYGTGFTGAGTIRGAFDLLISATL
ncbi:uncharacterized protein Dyak_GE11134 [Drosophila yakuba]|uniref:Uncharacterized protein n=1 Tax=Drosophila yakuba TaxID=7245 RepID=B4IUS7_DROYA|nr:uncharacterized protein Dyak_GE11134 [Drosophila yakuba]